MTEETIETVNLNQLTIGDLRELKRLLRERAGMSWTEGRTALDEGDPDAVGIVVYLIKHREDPSVTLEDVDELKIGVLPRNGSDPTSAAGSPS